MLEANKKYHVISKVNADLRIVTYTVSDDTRYWATPKTAPRSARLAEDIRLPYLTEAIWYSAKKKSYDADNSRIDPSVEHYLQKLDNEETNILVKIVTANNSNDTIVLKREELKFIEDGQVAIYSFGKLTLDYFNEIKTFIGANKGDFIVLRDRLFCNTSIERGLREAFKDDKKDKVITLDAAEEMLEYLEALVDNKATPTPVVVTSMATLKKNIEALEKEKQRLTNERNILEIEKTMSQKEIGTLKKQVPSDDSEALDALFNQNNKLKGHRTIAFVLAALMALTAGYFVFFNKKTALTVAENPLKKRIDDLVENRIYLKQLQLVTDSKGVNPSSDEALSIYKTQETLNKALFELHKVKFDLLPQVEAKKMTESELIRELNKIESEIK